VFNQEAFARLGRFLFTGGLAALVDCTVLWTLSRRLGVTAAFSCAYVSGVTVHFCLNKWWTFRCVRRDLLRQVGSYLLVTLVTYSVQLVVFRGALAALRADWLGLGAGPWQLYLAKATAIPPSTLIGYYLFKQRVFATEKPAGAAGL
jgi:putative flippase GtrA